METQNFIEKYQAIFPDVSAEIAEGVLADWNLMISAGNVPATEGLEKASEVLALFEEVKTSATPSEEIIEQASEVVTE